MAPPRLLRQGIVRLLGARSGSFAWIEFKSSESVRWAGRSLFRQLNAAVWAQGSAAPSQPEPDLALSGSRLFDISITAQEMPPLICAKSTHSVSADRLSVSVTATPGKCMSGKRKRAFPCFEGISSDLVRPCSADDCSAVIVRPRHERSSPGSCHAVL